MAAKKGEPEYVRVFGSFDRAYKFFSKGLDKFEGRYVTITAYYLDAETKAKLEEEYLLEKLSAKQMKAYASEFNRLSEAELDELEDDDEKEYEKAIGVREEAATIWHKFVKMLLEEEPYKHKEALVDMWRAHRSRFADGHVLLPHVRKKWGKLKDKENRIWITLYLSTEPSDYVAKQFTVTREEWVTEGGVEKAEFHYIKDGEEVAEKGATLVKLPIRAIVFEVAG